MAFALTAKAFDTLAVLIENRDRIVGKDELLASVWAGRTGEESNLTQAVRALRRSMGAAAGDHRYVVTIPGRGYRFVAEVEESEHDEAPAAVANLASVATPVAPDVTLHRRCGGARPRPGLCCSC